MAGADVDPLPSPGRGARAGGALAGQPGSWKVTVSGSHRAAEEPGARSEKKSEAKAALPPAQPSDHRGGRCLGPRAPGVADEGPQTPSGRSGVKPPPSPAGTGSVCQAAARWEEALSCPAKSWTARPEEAAGRHAPAERGALQWTEARPASPRGSERSVTGGAQRGHAHPQGHTAGAEDPCSLLQSPGRPTV
ncbi:collagen alpha-1(I) chain-like [Sciurus carolinensis]|uniref:collagen alpha-1(I) chain-like n=1 Tax=Sciurus carolinensis TaxID=30640 RepID=UPI001FB24EC8|nr:collagen alpha-1(I) chain-like [Sciurus carolinensis]